MKPKKAALGSPFDAQKAESFHKGSPKRPLKESMSRKSQVVKAKCDRKNIKENNALGMSGRQVNTF
ncbi:MAG TPA: hypothetical protein PKL92_04810 [Aquaticitalea sp.]|nr:hypothetical protein [Aquaticitalea sp.]HNU59939.1 hypothetical protein [Aquaticitalea sp.]